MTTYILHGGRTSRDLPANNKFFTEFTNFPNKEIVNILLCYWARKAEEREEIIARDIKRIGEFSSIKKFTVSIAEDAKDFTRKINQSDVLYIAGGSYTDLHEEFAKIGKVDKFFDGKFVIGSSAGAFLLAKYSISSFNPKLPIYHGLGAVPISVLCHWDVEEKKEEKLKKLLDYAPNIPLLILDEGDWAKFCF